MLLYTNYNRKITMSKTRGWLCLLFLIALSCKKEPTVIKSSDTRTYKMGFQSSAPRADFELAIKSLHMWEQRADAAIISSEVPWDSLLAGTSPESYVLNNYKSLVDYYRSKNFEVWIYIDPVNGLNRASDALALVNRGKSIAQKDVQSVYKRYAFVIDSILQPEHLGLALETNFIRGLSPDSIYQGVKNAANESSKEIRTFDKKVKLSISVQVDYAWGKLDNSSFKPIDKDLTDFAFIDELGLSSYPYFAFDKPEEIPLNYYSQLISGKTLPVFVSEQGWPSVSVDNIISSPEKQRDYIYRQAQLLDEVKATAQFQLTFTDIDLSAQTGNYPENLYLFAAIGFVDINLNPKPSLTAWDSLFKRKYIGD